MHILAIHGHGPLACRGFGGSGGVGAGEHLAGIVFSLVLKRNGSGRITVWSELGVAPVRACQVSGDCVVSSG